MAFSAICLPHKKAHYFDTFLLRKAERSTILNDMGGRSNNLLILLVLSVAMVPLCASWVAHHVDAGDKGFVRYHEHFHDHDTDSHTHNYLQCNGDYEASVGHHHVHDHNQVVLMIFRRGIRRAEIDVPLTLQSRSALEIAHLAEWDLTLRV